MTKLSIIIPCYNYARYLRASVDSVLNQHYSDYELILIDDGSSDETWSLMQEYAERYSHIKIIQHEQNRGIFEANNTGWRVASGEYLHFFSADDLYEPNCLVEVMHLFEKHPHLKLVCTDIGYFKDGTNETTTKPLLNACNSSRVFSQNEMISLFQKTEFWVPGLTCIVRADSLKKHGHLNPLLENISDWFCFHKIALLEGVGYIPKTLISMRLHDQTYTSQVKRNKKRRRATYYILLKHLSENREIRKPFKESGLLTFIFRELYWKLRFNPRYLDFWPYLKK